METRGYELYNLLSFGTLDKLKEAQQGLKRSVIKNVFGIAVFAAGGACIMYAGGKTMISSDADTGGKGDGVSVVLGLAGILAGAAVAGGGSLVMVKKMDRNMNDMEKLEYVIQDRTPRNG